ncbi:MMPL family transporter [Jidongwangia harbinensis]|uniref:MMPL family transporter n=1 Tax=Jidongwangia harbinensis TaxID=2878561 RepID=UPI001CD9846D|nr:MMPL family transporter [Jidongwangia harbinensis]MCA2215329.1 MMPL family transporter [Jidongwangia harbinensis]
MARLLFRLGTASARHRKLVFVVWGLAFAVLGLTAVRGTEFSDDAFVLPGSESSRALDRTDRYFPGTDDDGTLQLVLTARDGSPITSAANRARVAQTLAAAGTLGRAGDPFDRERPYVSPDRTTAVSTVELTDPTEAAYHRVLAVAAQARAAGLGAEVGGSIVDPAEESSPAEAVGVILAFLILLVTYGSLVAAGANMLGSLIGVAVGSLGVLAFSAIRPIGDTTPTLAVMIGLAVGIDYCLFILARFRTELRDGRTVEQAIGYAVRTAGAAVVFAGTTVIIALAGLAVVRIEFLTEMGMAAAFAVVVAVLMALTLLPALMRSMGRRALPRRERRTGVTPHRGTFLKRWINLVVRRPVAVLVVAVTALLALATPVLSLHTSLTTPGGDDPASTRRAAYDRIAAAFGAGHQGPLIVLVEGRNAERSVPAVTRLLTGLAGVTAVAPAGVTAAGDAALVQVVPARDAVDRATRELVHDIRDHAGDVAGVRLSVTGSTAIDIDTTQALNRALVTYLFVIVGLSLLLLIVMFRALVVPLMATLGFLLSLGTAVGVTVAVFQWGWAAAVFAAPSGNPLMSMLPVLLVAILFGLAMDYQVFLVSRIHEARRPGRSPADAVLDGFGRAAPVVVAAALIMTAVFAGFALSPTPIVASIGLALAAGVLADAFVVRMLITPALLVLLGDRAWWIPRTLDRILPHLDPEGAAPDAEPAAAAAPSGPAGSGQP